MGFDFETPLSAQISVELLLSQPFTHWGSWKHGAYSSSYVYSFVSELELVQQMSTIYTFKDCTTHKIYYETCDARNNYTLNEALKNCADITSSETIWLKLRHTSNCLGNTHELSWVATTNGEHKNGILYYVSKLVVVWNFLVVSIVLFTL